MRRYELRVVLLRLSALSLLAAAVALSACGGSGPSGEVITKGDEVVGVWRRTGPPPSLGHGMVFRTLHIKFEADGTMAFGVSPDKWDYEFCIEEFAFEGTQFRVTEITCPGLLYDTEKSLSCAAMDALSGVYEVQLLANGNLNFIDAGDNCQTRRDILTLAEWAPVL